MNELVDSDIPSEFENVTVASTSFSKMLSPLDDDFPFSSLKILLCQILITKDNQLIQLVDGEVKRIKRLNFQDTKKVIVYHEFNPERRFVVCHTRSKIAYLLLYESLEVINQWNEIKDINIDDPLETGKPKLQLHANTGVFVALEEKDFIIGKQTHDLSKGKEEAKTALANKLKACLLRSQSLQLEYQRKELYVIRKLSDITNQLKLCNNIAMRETSALNKPDKSINSSEESNLKILATRQRLVHGKWIICVSVVNTSSKFLICDPQLTLHCSSLLKRLCYETKFMKTVQRTNPYQESDSDIFVEEINPPILRPGKRAYLIAICRMPDFTECWKASCSGLISFKVRSLQNLNSEEDIENKISSRQITFPSVDIDSFAMKSKCINLSSQSFTTGFSMDVMALVASSVKRILTVVSIVTPLIQVIHTFSNHKCIMKMSQMNNFYFFNTSVIDPVHYAAFSCKLISAQKLLLTTYTRDDNQCYLLLRHLQKMMPKDILVSTSEIEEKTDFDNVQNNLISKMYECITVISNKGQPNLRDKESKKVKKSPSNKCSTELYEERRKYLLDIQKDIVWNGSEYATWRELLHNFQIKMEQLYWTAFN